MLNKMIAIGLVLGLIVGLGAAVTGNPLLHGIARESAPLATQGCAAVRVSRRVFTSAKPAFLYKWSKDFMEAGKKRLAGDIVRQANSSEVTHLRKEARELKEVVAEQTLELRLLKKSMIGDGGEDV